MTKTYRSATLREVLAPMTSRPILYVNSVRSIKEATDIIEARNQEIVRLNMMLVFWLPIAFVAGAIMGVIAWRIVL